MDYYRKLISKMSNHNARNAKLNIDMYDDKQEDITREFIDNHTDISISQRKQYIVRTINITKRIIESSGMLFNTGVPTFVAKDKAGVIDETITAMVGDLIDYADMQLLFSQIDTYTRLLGSCGMLFGYDPEEQKLVIDIIHHANSYIITESNSRTKINTLIRLLDDNKYEIWTPSKRIVIIDSGTNITVESEDDNTFGVVPVVIFCEGNPPLSGGPYREVETELTKTNLAINKMISDLQYSVAWAASPTLFLVGCHPSLDDKGRQQKLSAGPESVIHLSTDGNGAEVEYKAPTIDIAGFNENIKANIKSIADKYGVRTETDTSNITSGFSLIVREIRTLEIRQKRQRAFEACVGTSQKVLKTILGKFGIEFPDGVNLVIEIPKADLPVDDMTVEQVWTERINNGRATVIDYLMDVRKLSPQEAAQKLQDIRDEKAANMANAQSNIQQDNQTNNQANNANEVTTNDQVQ